LGKLTFEQVLSAVEQQILFGKTFLGIAKGLLAAEPVVFGAAPTFFGLTSRGSIDLAQMAIARLYDRKGVTVPSMLVEAKLHIKSFQKGDPQQVIEEIAKSETAVLNLKPVLTAIRDRRNKWLAHLDPETVRDPQALSTKAKLTIEDLDRAFEETEKILSRIEGLFNGKVGPIRFVGGDDYRGLLERIRWSVSDEKSVRQRNAPSASEARVMKWGNERKTHA
jgi:AbiU2